MKEFNSTKWRQFIIAENSDFGNDPEDRYKYARKFTADLPDTARSEYLVSSLEDALEDYRLTDEVGEFDQAFVDIMKALGKEKELSEDLFSPNEMSAMAIEKEMAEGKGIPDVNTDFSVDTDFSDDLSENDEALDEILKEEKFNVIVKKTGEIIDDKLPKDLATKLAAKKNGWVIQKVEEALDESKLDKEKFTKPDQMRVNETKFEIGDKVTMKAGGGEMEIVGARRMFGSNTQAYKVKKADGETVEYSANQLKKA